MRKREVTVEELMSTALVTARADETVHDVDLEMKMANVRHIPVIDQTGRLVGIVSQRDLLRARIRAGTPVPIRSIMSKQVWTIERDAPALDAIDILLDRKIGCVPVVGDDGQLVGIVTETDFLRMARDAMVGRGTRRDIREVG